MRRPRRALWPRRASSWRGRAARSRSASPPAGQRSRAFGALARKPAEARHVLARIAGVVPVGDVTAPRSVARIVGLRGMARLALAGRRGAASPAALAA